MPPLEGHFGGHFVVCQKNTFIDVGSLQAAPGRAASEPSRSRETSPEPAEFIAQVRPVKALQAFLTSVDRPKDERPVDDDSTAPTEGVREEDDSTLDTDSPRSRRTSVRAQFQPFHEQEHLKAAAKPRKKRPKPAMPGTKRVFVGGLSNKTTSASLFAAFAFYDTAVRADVMRVPGSSQCRGFGYVMFLGEVPGGVVGRTHLVDGRMCGVRAYKQS